MMSSARSSPGNFPRRAWSSPAVAAQSRVAAARRAGGRAQTRVEAAVSGLVIDVESSWGEARLDVPLIGDFNADNALTVLAVLLAWEVPLAAAAAALESCRAAPGRMEAFGGRDGAPLAIVDYAHTPDALAKALRAARRHCGGRLRVRLRLRRRPRSGQAADDGPDRGRARR